MRWTCYACTFSSNNRGNGFLVTVVADDAVVGGESSISAVSRGRRQPGSAKPSTWTAFLLFVLSSLLSAAGHASVHPTDCPFVCCFCVACKKPARRDSDSAETGRAGLRKNESSRHTDNEWSLSYTASHFNEISFASRRRRQAELPYAESGTTSASLSSRGIRTEQGTTGWGPRSSAASKGAAPWKKRAEIATTKDD